MELEKSHKAKFPQWTPALALMAFFAVVLLLIMALTPCRPPTPEEATSAMRDRAKQAYVKQKQASTQSQAASAAAQELVAQNLFKASPKAMDAPEFVAPGTATAAKMAQAPTTDTTGMDSDTAVVEISADLMAKGKAQFTLCAACHGAEGQGGPIAPPLAKSEWVTGKISHLIKIQMRGVQGPIKVDGKEYNFTGGMAPMNFGSDEEIAALLTYVRNSFGNKASPVKPEYVKSLRGEAGKPQITAQELSSQ